MSINEVYNGRAGMCCYLIRSINASFPTQTYVGFTPQVPGDRLLQHNGEKPGGARLTEHHRPWELAAVVRGFPVSARQVALRFEFSWQHPEDSRLYREAFAQLYRDHYPTSDQVVSRWSRGATSGGHPGER